MNYTDYTSCYLLSNCWLFYPHFLLACAMSTTKQESVILVAQSKCNYEDAEPLIRLSITVTSAPWTHSLPAAVSQVKVWAKSLLSVIPCEGNGAWDGSDMRDHHPVINPASAGDEQTPPALIYIWIPWSRQEQILLSKQTGVIIKAIVEMKLSSQTRQLGP